MPTIVACPECDSKLRVPDGLSGQAVRCARCGATFTAPEDVLASEADGWQQHAPLASEPRPFPPPPYPHAPHGEDLGARPNLSLDEGSPSADAPPREVPGGSDPEPPPIRRPLINDDEDDLRDCPHCGKHVHRDRVRCPFCGKRLAREQTAPRYRARRDTEPHRGGLVLSLGIIALVAIGVCAPVGLVLGIVAWVMGRADLQKIRRGEMDADGEGMTLAGRICGIIATALNGLIMMFLCGMMAFVLVAADRPQPMVPGRPVPFQRPAPIMPRPIVPRPGPVRPPPLVPRGRR